MHDFSCQPYLTLIVILFDDAYSTDKTCPYWFTGEDLSPGVVTAPAHEFRPLQAT